MGIYHHKLIMHDVIVKLDVLVDEKKGLELTQFLNDGILFFRVWFQVERFDAVAFTGLFVPDFYIFLIILAVFRLKLIAYLLDLFDRLFVLAKLSFFWVKWSLYNNLQLFVVAYFHVPKSWFSR